MAGDVLCYYPLDLGIPSSATSRTEAAGRTLETTERGAEMRAISFSGCLIGLVASLGLSSAAMAGPSTPTEFVGFDFNGDGKGDFATSSALLVTTKILDGTVQTATGTITTGGRTLKAIGNMNADANADLIVQGGSPSTTRITFMNATGTGASSTPALFVSDANGAWVVVDAADVNGDGIDEVIFQGTGAALGSVRIANVASGTPVFTSVPTAGTTWQYAFHANVNGDTVAGKPVQDLLFRGTGSGVGTTRANLGGSSANQRFYPQGGTSWVLTSTGDTNNDGTDDLADTGTGAGAGFNRVRTLNTSGNIFGATGFIPNGGNSFILKAMGDFNNDGNEDLMSQGTSSFKVTPMTGVVPGTAAFPASGGGSFTLRSTGDTNADGRSDLIATNVSGVRVQVSTGLTTTNGAVIPSSGQALFVGP